MLRMNYNPVAMDSQTNPRQVVITLKREFLIYDIKNYAYVEADIAQKEDAHEKHQVFDICEDGNIDRVTRVLNLAFDEIVNLLYAHTKGEIQRLKPPEEAVSKPDIAADETINTDINEPEEYQILMRVPVFFSKTTARLLAQLIHEYMVCRVLADWTSITLPEKAETWQSKSEVAKQEICSSLNMRTRRIRRTLTPF